MIARIHHVKNGIEHVLQFNSRTDTIELRKNRLMLIGGVPNYFRDNGLRTALEVHTFKITVCNWRPLTMFSRLPMLSDEEKALIHEFEQIANINLFLTPESVSRHRLANMQEMARLTGADLTLTSSHTSHVFREMQASLSTEWDMIARQRQLSEDVVNAVEQLSNLRIRMREELAEQLTHTPESLRAAHPDMNTEGLTEEQVQENLEFVARLLNGETIPATEAPPQESDVDDDDIDGFLKDVETLLDEPDPSTDEVFGAPAHRLEIPASVMSQLWRQAQGEDTENNH